MGESRVEVPNTSSAKIHDRPFAAFVTGGIGLLVIALAARTLFARLRREGPRLRSQASSERIASIYGPGIRHPASFVGAAALANLCALRRGSLGGRLACAITVTPPALRFSGHLSVLSQVRGGKT